MDVLFCFFMRHWLILICALIEPATLLYQDDSLTNLARAIRYFSEIIDCSVKLEYSRVLECLKTFGGCGLHLM